MNVDTQTWETISSEIPVVGTLTGKGFMQGITNISRLPKQIPITDTTHSITIPATVILFFVIMATGFAIWKKMNIK